MEFNSFSVKLYDSNGSVVNKTEMVFENRSMALDWACFMLNEYKGSISDFSIIPCYQSQKGFFNYAK
jgi:hypothetical protein